MVLVTAPATGAQAPKTGLDTAHREAARAGGCERNRAALTALLLVFLLVPVPVWSVTAALAGEEEASLPGSGIRYPDGYDSNTVGEVRGTAHDLLQPERGPVRFRLASERETYTVLASPRWYWNDVGASVTDGTEIRVWGSKSLGRDGNLYIIAQEIEILPDGKELVFRSDDGAPLWRGTGMGKGRGRGGYGTSHGPGGPGGVGGRGRGGR